MPWNIGDTINQAADSILKSKSLKSVISSPLRTALIIVAVICVIILYIFRSTTADESLIVLTMRVGFWAAISTIIVMFLHNKIILKSEEKVSGSDLFDGYTGPGMANSLASTFTLADAIVPVNINAVI